MRERELREKVHLYALLLLHDMMMRMLCRDDKGCI